MSLDDSADGRRLAWDSAFCVLPTAYDLDRWLTPDPMGGDITNPQSLNRYAGACPERSRRVLNNPATLTDPLGLFSDNPGDPCSDPTYAESHAECQGFCDPAYDPSCSDDCVLYGDCGYIGGGGYGNYGGGGGGPITPPAGQPPLAGGDSFSPGYSCLTPTQISQLESDLLNIGSEALGAQLSRLGREGPVIGGAQNVLVGAQGGSSVVYVNPSVVAQAQAADPLERLEGWKKQLIVPDTHLPGPGNVVHILFNPGAANAQGQVGITAIKIHADIANPQDVVSGLHHVWSDVFLASLSASQRNPACAVKFY